MVLYKDAIKRIDIPRSPPLLTPTLSWGDLVFENFYIGRGGINDSTREKG
jgi:hypothetical protein